jgi:DNA-binding NarL/FixJ family response regulator
MSVVTAPEPHEQIRIVIADDHDLYRRGMQAVMSTEGDLVVVGEARDGDEVVRVAVDLAPDVVLMDVRMPARDGIDACRSIKERVPASKIIMLTSSDEESDLFEALKAGASGYLLKELPAEEIAASIRSVHGGQPIIPAQMAAQLITEFGRISRHSEQAPPGPKLTDRELEVLRLVSRGLGNREIAQQLFISENTVKNHVSNILEKLQLHSRIEAALYAMKSRLIDPEP